MNEHKQVTSIYIHDIYSNRLPLHDMSLVINYVRGLKQGIVVFKPISVRRRMIADITDYVLVDGALRLEAAKYLGWVVVPCYVEEDSMTEHWLKCHTPIETCPVFPDDTRLSEPGFQVDVSGAASGRQPCGETREARGYGPEIQGESDRCNLADVRTSPKSRGKVLCLKPLCKKWISPSRKVNGLHKINYFCAAHRVDRIDSFPFHDRDGNRIWVTGDRLVIKISEMEDSHLMNSIMYLEKAADRRSAISGRPAADCLKDWPRYEFLVDEVKQRDTCKKCKDGVVGIEYLPLYGVDGNCKSEVFDDYSELPVVVYCDCQRGQVRKAATAVKSEAAARNVPMSLSIVLAIVTALLAGGLTAHAAEFIRAVWAEIHVGH